MFSEEILALCARFICCGITGSYMYDKVDNGHGEMSLVKRTLCNLKVCDNTTPNSDNLGSRSRRRRPTAKATESMGQQQTELGGDANDHVW